MATTISGPTKKRGVTMRYRLGVASRALAGVAGGYAFSALLTACLTLTLPLLSMSRAESVQTATMLSFAVYAVAVM
ncbi:hypothetical protein [Rugamonas sp.]|uniref:hypothetical protein n=1 Tax=Rugamonas sp. TaxID=1926287 RepID=UPI00345C38F8